MDENIIVMAETNEGHDEPTTEVRDFQISDSVKSRIAELDAEIESYRSQIIAAEGALDSAEKELDEVLSELC